LKKPIKVPPNWEDRPDSFKRFESLAKGLMAVPKKELDKEVETHKKRAKKPPRKKTNGAA